METSEHNVKSLQSYQYRHQNDVIVSFIVSFEQVSHMFRVYLLLILNK